MTTRPGRYGIGVAIALWLVAILAAAILVIASAGDANGAVMRETAPAALVDTEDGPPISNAQIEQVHDRAQACRKALGFNAWPSGRSWEWATGRVYRGWLYALWLTRAGYCEDVTANIEADVRYGIRFIFTGPGDWRYADADSAGEQAVRVAYCESRWKPYDQTGQYVGLFQLGDRERAQYGVGAYASGDRGAAAAASNLEQIRSARRMFNAAGNSWARWQCRPGSGSETSYSLGW